MGEERRGWFLKDNVVGDIYADFLSIGMGGRGDG